MIIVTLVTHGLPRLSSPVLLRKFTNKKNVVTFNSVIYTIQTFTIVSQQNKRDIGTLKLHNICKRFTITVVSDLKKK